MATATITSKGQMTIPKAIRELLDLKPGDKVDLVPDAHGRVIIRGRRITRFEDLFGILPSNGITFPTGDFDDVIADAVGEADERTRTRR